MNEGKTVMKSHGNQQDLVWRALQAVMPEAKKISESQREKLYGLVRRSLLWEKHEETEATQVYRTEHIAELRALMKSLTVSTEEEINQAIDELQLSREERELEYAHWAFRRQSVSGELLIQDELIAFKLVRLYHDQYLLMCSRALPSIVECFTRVFEREPEIFSEKALSVENQSWVGWFWILDQDQEKTKKLREKIQALWKATER